MKKSKSKGKNPGTHPAGYTSNKPQAARGGYNLSRKKRSR